MNDSIYINIVCFLFSIWVIHGSFVLSDNLKEAEKNNEEYFPNIKLLSLWLLHFQFNKKTISYIPLCVISLILPSHISVLTPILISLFIIDKNSGYLPTLISTILLFLGIISFLSFAQYSFVELINYSINALTVSTVVFCTAFILSAIKKEEVMGGGDHLLIFCLLIFLKASYLVASLFILISCMLAICSILLRWLIYTFKENQKVPFTSEVKFGPYLITSFILLTLKDHYGISSFWIH